VVGAVEKIFRFVAIAQAVLLLRAVSAQREIVRSEPPQVLVLSGSVGAHSVVQQGGAKRCEVVRKVALDVWVVVEDVLIVPHRAIVIALVGIQKSV